MADHVREHRSLLAASEKRLLIAIARRLPQWVTSDGLTWLACLAMCAAGGAFILAGDDPRWLWAVVVALAVNWFGDSLDGTLARVRHTERPRYGFYVDHVVDLLGATALLGGLAASSFMSPLVALALLVGYLLVSGEVFLATAVHRVFRMSFAGIGPTELRILLACGTLALRTRPQVELGAWGAFQLFDVAGIVAIGGLGVALATSVARNARELARLEPLPRSGRPCQHGVPAAGTPTS